MNVLLFSDLHCDVEAARHLVAQAGDVDVVIGAGDFAVCRRGIEHTIDVLQAIDRPTVVVPGNAESAEELNDACRKWTSVHVLHGSGVTIDGIDFWGLGGGVPITPFGAWSYDFAEDQAAAMLADCPAGAVLVTHSPPKGAADLSAAGKSMGSVAICKAIKKTQPVLAVCGHIHDSWGQTVMIGSTPVVNAGPGGLVWEL